jgi:hypothetical protein
MQDKINETVEPARMDIRDLLPIGLVIIVTGIALSFGAQVQGEVADDFEANSYEANISDKAQEATWNLSKKMPTIGTIAGIVIIIGLLLSGFAYLMSRR